MISTYYFVMFGL